MRGFSLVEVTLAMGIAGFALLVIFSLMPTGSAVMQDAGRRIAEAEIFNRIGSELSSTPLYASPTNHTDCSLQDYVGSSGNRFPVYFDVEGNELAQSAMMPANAVYTVRAKVTFPQTTVWSPTNGAGQSSAGNWGELCYGTVYIGFHQDPNTNPAAPNPAITTRTFLFSNRGNSSTGVTTTD